MGAHWQAGERRNCSACGAPCIGARSRKGSVGPIELAPNPKGNVILFKDAKDELRYAVLPKGDVRGWVLDNFMVLRVNHFATCPRASEFGREARDAARREETHAD